MDCNYIIRKAQRGDEKYIHKLIVDLAIYEKEPNAVSNSEEDLAKHLFDEKVCSAFILEVDSKLVGFALYYTAYSTWKGKTLYLEDFYIAQAFRRKGLGKPLFNSVKQEAIKSGVKRMDWQVLSWNKPAISFYEKEKALLDEEWINGRLEF